MITPLQYASMLARTEKLKSECEDVRRIANGESRESILKGKILEHCKSKGWMVFHGSMAHRTFRTEGEPDLHVWADGGRKFAFELKSKGGKLSTAQQAIMAWAKKLGHDVHSIKTLEQFIEITKDHRCHNCVNWNPVVNDPHFGAHTGHCLKLDRATGHYEGEGCDMWSKMTPDQAQNR